MMLLLHCYLVANSFFIIYSCFLSQSLTSTSYFFKVLRADTASLQRENHRSLLPGLPLFWSDPTKSSAMEWERWLDLFTVAVMAKYSISVEDLTRMVDADHPRVKAPIADMA